MNQLQGSVGRVPGESWMLLTKEAKGRSFGKNYGKGINSKDLWDKLSLRLDILMVDIYSLG